MGVHGSPTDPRGSPVVRPWASHGSLFRLPWVLHVSPMGLGRPWETLWDPWIWKQLARNHVYVKQCRSLAACNIVKMSARLILDGRTDLFLGDVRFGGYFRYGLPPQRVWVDRYAVARKVNFFAPVGIASTLLGLTFWSSCGFLQLCLLVLQS